MINMFSSDFEGIYGLRYQTMNFHIMSHLPTDCRNLGNLWNFDCFGYEDLSGQFVKMLHGTKYVEKQIVRCAAVCKKLPCMLQDSVKKSPSLMENKFVASLFGKSNDREIKINHDIYLLGAGKKQSDANLVELLHTFFETLPSNMDIVCYQRIRYKGLIYHSEMYKRVEKKKLFHGNVWQQ